MSLAVWPARAAFAPGEPVHLVLGTPPGGTPPGGTTPDGTPPAVAGPPAASGSSSPPPGPLAVTVTHLGTTVHTGGSPELGAFPEGGYAVTVARGDEVAYTAFDVLDSPLRRPRYGFLTDFAPDRGPAATEAAVVGLLRNHLTLVQFYDWMYRHATLLSPVDEFTDPLGRRLSHATARDLAARVRAAGALPLGYAAVYGAGAEYADRHRDQVLYHADGSPWTLADFLWIANPSADRGWRDHIVAEFRAAVARIGFAGLHLDQYGAPKLAQDDTGELVDLVRQFPDLIAAVRAALPDAALVFNNVNDYPTWATATAPQDASYIEVWSPHTTYAHLAGLVAAARGHAPGRPVILAAYLEPFVRDTPARSLAAARLTLATIYASGGHSLLFGEGDGVLVDPYYPKFARLGPAAADVLRRYQDIAVACGDVLYDPAAADVTTSHAGGINDDVELDATVDPQPGRHWVRVRRGRYGLTVHVIDLTAQRDIRWNEGKAPPARARGLRLRLRCPAGTDQVLVAGPELAGGSGAHLRAVPGIRVGDHLDVVLPDFTAWVIVHLPLP